MSVPRITVLGSCRVYEPIRRLEQAGKLELRNKGVYGYVHYAKEVVQQLQAMHGQIEIPFELKTYITHKVIPEGAGRSLRTSLNDLSETDLLVVEVSSLKEIEFDGYYLQINRLREKLVGDDDRLKAWWAYLYDKGVTAQEEGRVHRRQFLSAELPPAARRLVMWTNVAIQDDVSLRADMRTISSYFSGPILWVSHFDTLTFDEKPIPIRKTLVRYLREGAEQLGQPWFNPTSLIERFGRRKALLDMSHYTPQFEETLSAHFEQLLPNVITQVREGARATAGARGPAASEPRQAT